MNYYFKKGGGNKPQPYVPPGHGDKSGEYTNKKICNVPGKYNYCNSKLVSGVNSVYVCSSHRLPITYHPNSVLKKVIDGIIISERYFDKNGNVSLDIDYTDHGNPGTHSVVPHVHIWYRTSDGKLKHSRGRFFI